MQLNNYHQLFEGDPYFSDEYIQCYLEENENIFYFEFKEEESYFILKAVKRAIDDSFGKMYYDLETVYGYGGYICNSDSEEFVEKAIKELTDKCISENIIAHFIRFHPLNDFPLKHGTFLNFSALNRQTVFINTSHKDEDEMRSAFSSSLKRNINKAKRAGLEFAELPKSSEYLDKFVDLYYATMERKSADDLYFFSKDYFSKLFNLDSLKVYGTLFEAKVISMMLTLDDSKGNSNYHLGATDSEFYSLNPNPFIINEIAFKHLNDTSEYFFLGGGNALEEDDNLFRFKKKFSKTIVPFYIGGNVFNEEIYNKYKKEALKKNDKLSSFFLSYRFA